MKIADCHKTGGYFKKSKKRDESNGYCTLATTLYWKHKSRLASATKMDAKLPGTTARLFIGTNVPPKRAARLVKAKRNYMRFLDSIRKVTIGIYLFHPLYY